MLIDIPDHYVANVGGALVERAVDVINSTDRVPAYLFQFEDLWTDGLRYGGSDTGFWQACYYAGAKASVLKRAGVTF